MYIQNKYTIPLQMLHQTYSLPEQIITESVWSTLQYHIPVS